MIRHVFGLFVFALSTSIGWAALTLKSYKLNGAPSMHSYGVQFDQNVAFAVDPSKTGVGRFVVTDDGGQTWRSLWVAEDGRPLGSYDDVRILYVNRGAAVVRLNSEMYCLRDGDVLQKCGLISACLRGQEGFALQRGGGNDRPSVATATNGGKEWLVIQGSRAWFDQITTFERINGKTVIAAVAVYGVGGRSEHRLAKTVDGGRSWTEVADPEHVPGIWATHLFFIDERYGWISSDRDNGVFYTSNGCREWVRVKAPARIISGLFFKDLLHGRIIGGLDGKVYETSNGGQTWRELSADEISRPSFLDYFKGVRHDKWNDFAVRHIIQKSQGEQVKRNQ